MSSSIAAKIPGMRPNAPKRNALVLVFYILCIFLIAIILQNS